MTLFQSKLNALTCSSRLSISGYYMERLVLYTIDLYMHHVAAALKGRL